MCLKYYKPTTPGQRHKVRIDYIKDGVWRDKPLKRLTYGLSKRQGRNRGLISSFHRGGGATRIFRRVDLTREILDTKGTIVRIEYDPNRSAYLFLVAFETGELSYLLGTDGVKVNDTIVITRENSISIKVGNSMPLKNIPVGTKVHNIETLPYKGGRLSRAAGTFAKIIKKEGGKVTVRVKAKREIILPENCLATIGVTTKIDHKNIEGGTAGYSRHLGRRPVVRGVAMNPVDHPHGGGEGKTSGGRLSVTPWSIPTKGYKTKRKHLRK